MKAVKDIVGLVRSECLGRITRRLVRTTRRISRLVGSRTAVPLHEQVLVANGSGRAGEV